MVWLLCFYSVGLFCCFVLWFVFMLLLLVCVYVCACVRACVRACVCGLRLSFISASLAHDVTEIATIRHDYYLASGILRNILKACWPSSCRLSAPLELNLHSCPSNLSWSLSHAERCHLPQINLWTGLVINS